MKVYFARHSTTFSLLSDKGVIFDVFEVNGLTFTIKFPFFTTIKNFSYLPPPLSSVIFGLTLTPFSFLSTLGLPPLTSCLDDMIYELPLMTEIVHMWP